MTSSLTSLTSYPAASRSKQLGLPDIALTGKAGAGKSTAASLLRELGYEPLGFTDPLKDVAAQLWGEDARTDRHKLQGLGDAVHAIDPDTLVKLLLRRVKASPLQIVVDDLRRGNECQALKAERFAIIRIEAPRSLRLDRLIRNGKWQSEEQLQHLSEIAVDRLLPDYTIVNDGATTDLYDELIDIIIKERKRR